MQTREEKSFIATIKELQIELQKYEDGGGEWVLVMPPFVWFGWKRNNAFEEYKRFLKTYMWSPLRVKLFPWLLAWERTQALIMRDELVQLYNDYECVEVKWIKKEEADAN